MNRTRFFVLLDMSVCCMCACTPVHVCFTIAVKIHEKHSLQSLRASTATPCDAVVSMSYKYTLLSSEGSQHSNTLIPHPLFLLYGCVCVCVYKYMFLSAVCRPEYLSICMFSLCGPHFMVPSAILYKQRLNKLYV